MSSCRSFLRQVVWTEGPPHRPLSRRIRVGTQAPRLRDRFDLPQARGGLRGALAPRVDQAPGQPGARRDRARPVVSGAPVAHDRRGAGPPLPLCSQVLGDADPRARRPEQAREPFDSAPRHPVRRPGIAGGRAAGPSRAIRRHPFALAVPPRGDRRGGPLVRWGRHRGQLPRRRVRPGPPESLGPAAAPSGARRLGPDRLQQFVHRQRGQVAVRPHRPGHPLRDHGRGQAVAAARPPRHAETNPVHRPAHPAQGGRVPDSGLAPHPRTARGRVEDHRRRRSAAAARSPHRADSA